MRLPHFKGNEIGKQIQFFFELKLFESKINSFFLIQLTIAL